MSVQIIPSADRAHWWNEWLDSRQSFPATGNFDLAGNAHGLLMVHNEDTVGPGEGFDTHQHRDMEIITWVLEGSVVHQDSVGNSGLIRPGLAQRMSAGTGITHSERNGATYSERRNLHVIQMWVPPDTDGVEPSYQELDIEGELANGEMVTVASGMPKHRDTTALVLENRFAALHAVRLLPGESVTVPDAPYGHVFVTKGAVQFEDVGALQQGDAVRLTSTGGHRVTAQTSSELLFWEMLRAAR